MRESAATVSELGLNGALAGEIAEVQERMGGLGLAGGDTPLDELVAAVLNARLARN